LIEKTKYTVDINRVLLEFEHISKKKDLWTSQNGNIKSYPFNVIGEEFDSSKAFYGDESVVETLDIFKDTYIEEIINDLPIKKGRCRFLLMEPPTIMRIHKDPSNRWHLPLYTNEYCGFMDENLKTYTMKADGYWYKFNTIKPHTAFNISRNASRLHLVVVEAYDPNDEFTII
jgi:hypothetical protein